MDLYLTILRIGRVTQHPSIQAVCSIVRERRKAAGWSQEAFAGHINLDRGYYSHIERGSFNISLLVLFRIAAGLGCQPAELMPDLALLIDLPPPSITRGRRQSF